MSTTDNVYVFAISEVLKISLIDGGDTLAVQLRDTGGEEIAFLASWNVARVLSADIQATMSGADHGGPAPRFEEHSRRRRQVRCSTIGDAPVLNVSLVVEA
ncbi:hypothetical protein [Methylobacterium sp. Leaf118]|uniref:hypothetical protein n=1 Tax=Methylobacterium sp. Leaf118 TaxID=2876562 RepID=UPI001E61E2D0|nr:hypothetical protein [Methylobacterium sp. Leaf118]